MNISSSFFKSAASLSNSWTCPSTESGMPRRFFPSPLKRCFKFCNISTALEFSLYSPQSGTCEREDQLTRFAITTNAWKFTKEIERKNLDSFQYFAKHRLSAPGIKATLNCRHDNISKIFLRKSRFEGKLAKICCVPKKKLNWGLSTLRYHLIVIN